MVSFDPEGREDYPARTVVRWHRAGFRCYWRWKSLGRGGRPQIETELRALIRRMSIENPLWGTPRIHGEGELLKLGLAVAQSSVAKYMVKRRGPPSQVWCTFLRSHAPDIAAMDLFVVRRAKAKAEGRYKGRSEDAERNDGIGRMIAAGQSWSSI